MIRADTPTATTSAKAVVSGRWRNKYFVERQIVFNTKRLSLLQERYSASLIKSYCIICGLLLCPEMPTSAGV